MIRIDDSLTPAGLAGAIEKFWGISAEKIFLLRREYDLSKGSPVFTVDGKYTARGWTEWTLGFYLGSAILQFDATGDEDCLRWGREATVAHMSPHVTHFGVHDHGFNNISTYGNLLRLMNEGRVEGDEWQRAFYELALKCSGAVQARRWTSLPGGGFIHSFNGPHSLFIDTIRSCRSLAMAHRLGQPMLGEGDAKISLLERMLTHIRTTLEHNVYFGRSRDAYDVRGRVAQESIFNIAEGRYRCPSSQQGYSPRTTWTRGLAWAMLGLAEELEFLQTVVDDELANLGGRKAIEAFLAEAAKATCDYYIETTPADGIPYWDTGAAGLESLGDYRNAPADPFNDREPVDSSAAAIACQGLMRLGHWLKSRGDSAGGKHYFQAGLTTLRTLLGAPYLCVNAGHQGLILHSVYHRPNGWDHIPPGRKIPCGESCLWGDYHAREAALYVRRIARGETYPAFFGPEHGCLM